MYELVRITENDYYIDCPAKVGVVRISGNEVVLIDSGSDKDAGKKVLKHLEAEGWTLKAIYNTHSHADHIGGNQLIQSRTGCPAYAKGMDCIVANSPMLEPTVLWGGLPLPELRNKFLMAKESRVSPLTEEVLPEGWKLIELGGHCFDMVGFVTPDGTAYIADSVSSEETLQKYGIAYMWNPFAAKESLERLKGLDAKCFVPSHAEVCEEIESLADINIAAIDGVIEFIMESCEEAIRFEDLIEKIFVKYGMSMSVQQYALIGSTVRSYLSCLHERGELAIECGEGALFWKKA